MKTPADILINRNSYSAKLRDPRWTAFSSSVRHGSGNACQICKRRSVVIQVHHIFYEPDREPWEYERDEVMVICSECHKALHTHLKQFRKHVFKHLNPAAFRVLNGALAVGLENNDPLLFVYALAELASSPGSVKRFASAWAPDGMVGNVLDGKEPIDFQI